MSNVPNLLTAFRIFSTPLMIASFYLPGISANITIAILFAVAGITDFFDGYFARSLNAESNFGKCLDPIADKLIVIVAISIVIAFGNVKPLIMIPAMIIICREIMVSGLREFLAEFKIKVPVTTLAKFKTGFQMVSITILILGIKGCAVIIYFVLGPLLDKSILNIIVSAIYNIGIALFLASAVLTLITGYDYFRAGVKKFND